MKSHVHNAYVTQAEMLNDPNWKNANKIRSIFDFIERSYGRALRIFHMHMWNTDNQVVQCYVVLCVKYINGVDKVFTMCTIGVSEIFPIYNPRVEEMPIISEKNIFYDHARFNAITLLARAVIFAGERALEIIIPTHGVDFQRCSLEDIIEFLEDIFSHHCWIIENHCNKSMYYETRRKRLAWVSAKVDEQTYESICHLSETPILNSAFKLVLMKLLVPSEFARYEVDTLSCIKSEEPAGANPPWRTPVTVVGKKPLLDIYMASLTKKEP